MGHCLGLWHSFHGEETSGLNCDDTISDPNVCPEFANGSNGSTCGDYVSDTPADPGFVGGGCTYTWSNLDPNGEPYNPNLDLIMSYAPLFCYQYHSEEQGARMREIIATSPILQACLVQPDMVSPTIASGTNPNWTTSNTPNNGDFLIEGDLVIESGATLTIYAGVKVHFGEQSKLIIKPNARLRLLGTLTGMGCSNLTWQGVQVWGGPPNASQYLVNGFRAQGRLETRIGAVIEHARTAVQLYGPTAAFPGGQISSERTTFRNNINGVVFAPYLNFFPYSGPFQGQPRAYFGSFSRCTFVTDNSYLHTTPFFSFLNMSGVDGVRAMSCTFRNTRTIDGTKIADWGYGIYANSAGFSVTNESVASINNDSEFSGFSYGIYAAKIATNRPFLVQQCNFNNCFTGIRNKSVSGATIILNNFNLGKVPKVLMSGQQTEGVIFETDISGFTCEENHFTRVPGSTGTQPIGTVCINTGAANKTIRRNTFTDLLFANVANQTNASFIPTEVRGLYYDCNQVFGSTSDDFTVPDGIIRTRQGIELQTGGYLAAGNRFAYTASDFANSGPQITYLYNPLGQNQEPIAISGVIKVSADPNPCDINYCAPPCRTNTQLDDVKRDYYVKQSAHSVLKSDYQHAPTDVKLATLSYYQRVMDENAYMVALHEMYDTVSFSADTLRKWVGNLNSIEGDLWLAGEYVAANNAAAALALLNLAPSKYGLPLDVQTDLNNYEAIINLLDGKPLYALDSVTQQSLHSYLNSGGYAESWAESILTLYGGFFPPEYVTVNAAKPAKTTTENIPNAQVQLISVQPNPARDVVRFVFAMPESSPSVSIQVFDLNGKAVFQKDGLPTSGTYVWDTASHPSGIYFYHFLAEGAIQKSGKLVLNK